MLNDRDEEHNGALEKGRTGENVNSFIIRRLGESVSFYI